MPIYMKFDGIDAAATLDPQPRGGGWLPYPGPASLASTLRRRHPGGVNGILIGLLKVPAYRITVGDNGIIAILIGLLLPAIQKLREAGASEARILSGALAPGGQLLFGMGDGSVRPIDDRPLYRGQAAAGNWLELLRINLAGGASIKSPRDASSGLPTGRRMF